MKRLSEFEKMVVDCKPTHFIFLSQEQSHCDPLEPCVVRFDFSEIFVDLASQSVFAKNGANFMSIERIVGVDVDEKSSPLWKTITFWCGGREWNTDDYSYKFLIA